VAKAATVKRFYTEVTLTPGLGIQLDARPVRTPAKALLTLPNAALAHAVAEEWRGQGDRIDPRTMPMTGLANAVIDRVLPDPAAFIAPLTGYAETDLVCYRAEEPFALVAKQNQDWNPLMGWAQTRFDVGFTLVRGIIHVPQPEETVVRLAAALAARAPWELAPLNPLITITGSLVIALALVEAAISPEAAFDAAHLDELWQEEQWGADDFALEARAARRADFMAAARFLALVQQG
jgi:chaperone required for assembly of F1-ATPase